MFRLFIFLSLPLKARRVYNHAEMRPSLFAADNDGSSKRASPLEGRRDGAHRISDIWRRLGMSGEALGMSGVARRSLARTYAIGAVFIGAICTIDLITVHHEEPQYGLAAPILWEGSSGLTALLFLWIPWLAYRAAPAAAAASSSRPFQQLAPRSAPRRRAAAT